MKGNDYMEITITKENFKAEVLNSEIPVVVDFWAEWCGPCKMLGPVIEQLAKEYDGKIKVGKINVDDENELAMQFRVVSIPTVVKFENGELTKSSIGYRTKEQLIELLEL